MGTPLSDDERESYAPKGGLLRKLLDDEMAPWPTREEVAYEDAALELLSGRNATLPLGQKAGGRLAAMELWFDSHNQIQWRIVHLDPPPPEDEMGAPDFPLPSPEAPGLYDDPWSQPHMEPTLAPDLEPRAIKDDPQA
jgi:hypothetical protein